jgi:hypothetical protein
MVTLYAILSRDLTREAKENHKAPQIQRADVPAYINPNTCVISDAVT